MTFKLTQMNMNGESVVNLIFTCLPQRSGDPSGNINIQLPVSEASKWTLGKTITLSLD